MRRRTLLASAPLLAAPALAAGPRPLRYIPQSNLMSLDPVWTSSIIVYIHSYMVYDTLFGIDQNYDIKPQMCAGYELSDDKLTWTFHLRDGLMFHDGEKVLRPRVDIGTERLRQRTFIGVAEVNLTLDRHDPLLRFVLGA